MKISEENGIYYTIIFDPDYITADSIIEIYDKLLLFGPSYIYGTKIRRQKFSYAKLKMMIKNKFDSNISNIFVGNDGKDSLIYFSQASKIIGEIQEVNIDVLLDALDNIFVKYGGVVGFSCSAKDHLIQNLTDVDRYKKMGKPLEDVTIIKDETFGEKIGIEQNPGHSHYISAGRTDLWFGSCWAMWFGPKYYQFIPQEVLSRYNECFENKRLTKDVIRILLHKDIWEYDQLTNRERQRRFRKQVGMDEVAHGLEQGHIKIELDPELVPHRLT